ncbi:MAG: SUMF1/EgtB/PvdO family nonheme iron enzyme [Candidatus Odyssella sp.]|nr:SUMF1/EgtB/PvdO family nonheme iron enzyme [Candidatus Odyssella sp.]
MAGASDIALKLVKACTKGACNGAIASLELIPGYKLGEEIAKEVAKEVFKGLVFEPGVERIAQYAAKNGFNFFGALRANDKRAALDVVAALTPQQALEASREVLREVNLPSAARRAVEGYVLSLPHSFRRGTTRFNDGGISATLLSQLPSTLGEFQKLLPARPPLYAPGERLADDYVLEELIGQGGYGEVWKAVHRKMRSLPPRAVKFFAGEMSRASLLRETSLIDRMQAKGVSENIVRLEATNLDHDPPYVAYEFVEGGDLVSWLAAHDGLAPNPERVKAILHQLANGLGFAHGRGIVHRDIKPGNVLIARDGLVKVGDFGIGALAAQPAAARADAEPDALGSAGTPAYVDPEREDEKPDPAEDVYALGVLGVQLLLGNLNRTPPLAWRGHLADKGVDPRFVGVLEVCLDRRSRRFRSGAEASAALAAIAAALEPPPPTGTGTATSVKKKRLLSRSRLKRTTRYVVEEISTLGRSTLGLFDLKKSVAAVPDIARRATATPSVLRTIQDHRDAPMLIALPPGRFLMGAPPEEEGRAAAEGPVHEVAIDYELAVGKGPVTFGEWDAAAAALGYRPSDAGWGRLQRPAINVSWDDAQRYVDWLRTLTGKPYRLLSEAEWEYVCRGGTLTPYWTGQSITCHVANFDDSRTQPEAGGALETISAQVSRVWSAQVLNRARTVPVDAFPANPFGLHDTHGNVWEWVEDAWHPNYEGAPTDGSAWAGGEPGMRVLRGGSWRMTGAALRSAHRYRRQKRHRGDQVGFRVARVLAAGERGA